MTDDPFAPGASTLLKPPSPRRRFDRPVRTSVNDAGHSLFSTILCVDSSETPLEQYRCHLTRKHHTHGPGTLFLTLDKLYYYAPTDTFICAVKDITKRVEVKPKWRPGWRRRRVGCVVIRVKSQGTLRFWEFEELASDGPLTPPPTPPPPSLSQASSIGGRGGGRGGEIDSGEVNIGFVGERGAAAGDSDDDDDGGVDDGSGVRLRTEQSFEIDKALMRHFASSVEKLRLGQWIGDDESSSSDSSNGGGRSRNGVGVGSGGHLRHISGDFDDDDDESGDEIGSIGGIGGLESDVEVLMDPPTVSSSSSSDIEKRMLEKIRAEMGGGMQQQQQQQQQPNSTMMPAGSGGPLIDDDALDEDGVLMPVVPPPIPVASASSSASSVSADIGTRRRPTAEDVASPSASASTPNTDVAQAHAQYIPSPYRTHETVPETPVIFSEANARFTPREVSSFSVRLSLQEMKDHVIHDISFVQGFHDVCRDKGVKMTQWKYNRERGVYFRETDFQMHINFPFTSREYVRVTSMEQLTVLKAGKRILWQMSFSPKGFFGSDTLVLQGNAHFIEAGRQKVRMIMRVGPIYVKNLTFLLKWKFTQVAYNILDDQFTAISRSLKAAEKRIRRNRRKSGRRRRTIAFSTRGGKKSSAPSPANAIASGGANRPRIPSGSANQSAGPPAAEDVHHDDDDEPEEEGEVNENEPDSADDTDESSDESAEFGRPSSLPPSHPPSPSLLGKIGLAKIVLLILVVIIIVLLGVWLFRRQSGTTVTEEAFDRLDQHISVLVDEVREYRDETRALRKELETAIALNEDKWLHSLKLGVELEHNWLKFEERYLDFSRRFLEAQSSVMQATACPAHEKQTED